MALSDLGKLEQLQIIKLLANVNADFVYIVFNVKLGDAHWTYL